MKVQRLILGILASATVFGLSPAQALAGTFSISPLRAELSSRAQTGALTLRNQESTPVVVQAEVLLWEQAEGEDKLSPTRDVLVSPAVFTIPGNGSQLVRVALRRAADAQRELSYRLILTEVPQQASPEFTGLNVALRLSLPIFVAPITTAEPRLEWSATRGAMANGPHGPQRRQRPCSCPEFQRLAGRGLDDRDPAGRHRLHPAGPGPDWTLDKKQNEATSNTRLAKTSGEGTTEAGDFEVEIRPEGP